MGAKTVGIFRAHSQRAITFIVEDGIAELGFDAALPGLLRTVRQRFSLVVANPGDRELQREFQHWETAVTAAINRQPRSFEQRISEEDVVRLRGNGYPARLSNCRADLSRNVPVRNLQFSDVCQENDSIVQSG